MKKTILLLTILTTFCSYAVKSQTSNLVYSLGKTGSTIEITSIASDASNNIYVCGSFTGSSVDFNPLGTAVTKSSLGGTDGFIAKYNAAGELAAVNTFGNSGAERAGKVYVDATGVYMLATVAAGIVKFDPSDFGTSGGSGAMALVKYNDQLALQSSILVKKAAGGTGDSFNDIKVSGTDIYVTGALNNSAVEFNPLGASKQLTPNGFTDIFVAKYNASLICQFAFNVGGIDGDAGKGIDVDGSGNIYVTGYFRGQGINLNPMGTTTVYEIGEAEELAGAVGDVFVAKYSPTTACQWAINIGAASADQGTDILVSNTGTVYVGGIVKDDLLPADFNTANPETNVYGGNGLNDIFVASYTTAGIYNWHLATGSTQQDDLATMAFDASGNILITGFAGGNVNFGNGQTISALGGSDVYFATISTSGTALSAYNEGGSGNEQGNGIAVTAAGNILLAGNLSASGDYDPTASPAGSITLKGAQDGFVVRYGPTCTAPVINTQPTNMVTCQGISTSFSVTATGATSYQWYKNGSAVSGATTASYTISSPVAADATTYTVDVVNTCQTITSNTVSLTVDPLINAGVIGNNQSICSVTAPAPLIEVSATTGGSSAATATYIWQRSPDGISNWTTISGATAKSYGPGVLTSTTSYRRLDFKGPSCLPAPTNVVTITVDPAVTAATISSDQTICSGSAPAQLTGAAAAGGSTSATASYVWESSVNGTTGWTTISGATLKDYTPGTLTADTYYRRTDKKGACAGVVSNVVTILVDAPVAVPVISSPQTICIGSIPVPIGGAPATGGSATATASYTWESSPNGTTGWTTISGITAKDYAPITLSTTTYYRRNDKKGACAPRMSNSIAITVDPVVTTPSISADQTICSGTMPTQIGGAAAGGGSTAGTAVYKWESSANGTTGWTTISGATVKDYTPAALTATTYYRRSDTKGACSAVVSNVVKITVDPVVTTPSISTDQTTCSGATPNQIGGAAAAGGSSATAMYTWESSSTGITGWTIISGATLKDYTPAALTATTYYRRSDTKGACDAAVSNVVKITVDPVVTTPSISADQTICSGATANQIGGSAAAGGSSATAMYTWESSSTGITGWTIISGATSKDYTPAALTATTYYRRSDTKGACDAAVSNTVKITVDAAVTAPAISADQTICFGSTPAQIGGSAATGGGSATATAIYKWESSANGTTGWTTISGATLKDYTPSALGATTYYRRSDTKGICSPAVSNVVKITVDPAVTIPVISADQTICSGSAPAQLTGAVAGGGSATATAAYIWETSSTGTSGWIIIASATSKDYTPGALTATTYYRRTDIKGVCSAAISNAIKITVNPIVTPSVSISTPATTICTGTAVTFNTAPANEGTAPTYQWKKDGVNISGETNASYTTTTATNGSSYSVALTSNELCKTTATVQSNNIVLTVTASAAAAVTVDAAPGNTICTGTSTTFTATPANGGTAPTYEWFIGTISQGAPSTTKNTFTSTTLTNGSQVKVRMVSNSGCASPSTAESTPITMTVVSIPTVNVNLAVDRTTICANEAVVFTATPSGGGTAPIYVWKNNGVIINGQNSSTYTTSSLTAGNAIKVEITSNAACATTTAVSSNIISVTVNASKTPSVSISTGSTTICAGASITFATNAVNPGATPVYKWKLNNNIIAGATGSSYTTTAASNGDVYSVELTSNVACAVPATVVSNDLTINVNDVTVIDVQPASQSVCALGNTVTFSVSASGTNLTYKWRKGSADLANGSVYSGVSTKDLTISNITASELATNYNVVVTGTCGNVTSANTTLSQTTTAITITTQPENQTVVTGGVITLSVAATGPTLTYQWKRNGTNLSDGAKISGSQSAILTITNAQPSDNFNDYVCVISSPCATQKTTNPVSVVVSTATSIQNAQAQGFYVMPNPSSGLFVLTNESTPFTVENIEIVSMQGVVVATKAISGTSNLSEEIHAQELPSGMYLLIIKGEGQQALLKIAIDK
jgi:hypothetical protein